MKIPSINNPIIVFVFDQFNELAIIYPPIIVNITSTICKIYV